MNDDFLNDERTKEFIRIQSQELAEKMLVEAFKMAFGIMAKAERIGDRIETMTKFITDITATQSIEKLHEKK